MSGATPKPKHKCEELELLRQEVKIAGLEAGRTDRFSRYGAAERQKEVDRKIDVLMKHLLAGHDGKPCPAGDRPIVKAR